MGKCLNVPNSILTSPPSADLWEGQTDENELGITYDFVELYTGIYSCLGEFEPIRLLSEIIRRGQGEDAEWIL